jgi:hypothetical protein
MKTMECIICKDTGAEPLLENTACSCKYKRHASCWIDYVHSGTAVKCLMCRKDLTIKQNTPNPKSTLRTPLMSAPYTPQQQEARGREISYEEFVDTIRQSTQSHQQNVIITPTPSAPPEPKKVTLTPDKVCKIVAIIAVAVAIVTIILLLF